MRNFSIHERTERYLDAIFRREQWTPRKLAKFKTLLNAAATNAPGGNGQIGMLAALMLRESPIREA